MVLVKVELRPLDEQVIFLNDCLSYIINLKIWWSCITLKDSPKINVKQNIIESQLKTVSKNLFEKRVCNFLLLKGPNFPGERSHQANNRFYLGGCKMLYFMSSQIPNENAG